MPLLPNYLTEHARGVKIAGAAAERLARAESERRQAREVELKRLQAQLANLKMKANNTSAGQLYLHAVCPYEPQKQGVW